jgi:hypothetical protein
VAIKRDPAQEAAIIAWIQVIGQVVSSGKLFQVVKVISQVVSSGEGD